MSSWPQPNINILFYLINSDKSGSNIGSVANTNIIVQQSKCDVSVYTQRDRSRFAGA